MDADDLRIHIAHILYGDGDDVSWHRAVQLSDMLMWELSLTECGGVIAGHRNKSNNLLM